jgi:glutamate-5-semialdehyde dehydrogenase
MTSLLFDFHMKSNLKNEITAIAKKARLAAFSLPQVPSDKKKKCILSMAQSLIKNKALIIKENRKDLALALRQGKAGAFLDRLRLDDARILKMAQSLKSIANLKDPVGEIIKSWKVPSGLMIKKIRVPIGVIAIIYESRPDVTSDCLGLCLKSSNALILRGGSAAIHSNIAIFNALIKVAKKYAIPEGAFALIRSTDRKSVDELLKLSDSIDLVIPRGGEGLIREVVKKSRIPVIKHYKGICTVFVDKYANLDMAYKVVLNAKVERPGVCNAMETLLVHKDIASRFLPAMIHLLKHEGVEVRGDFEVRRFDKSIKKARSKDFETEFLDLIIAVKIIASVEEAIRHINIHGSHHSDSIISEDKRSADRFLQGVDSACVFLNTSTRFSDGFEFGMGAEMGISTDKIHARGPMAAEELTTYKYQVFGRGQIRE